VRTAEAGQALAPGSVARPAPVGIVAAGTSDAAVAREAARTLEFNGVASSLFIDVGVAGLWRLTRALPAIAAHPVLIAVAGMDAALPTVLGGLVGALIIAVPTSVGYGVAAGGRTALDAILASCAPGIPVMNIDNGYGAACAALRALQALEALRGTERSVAAVAPDHQDSTSASNRRTPCNVANSYPPRSPASARPPA
jgi:NCAIR mutase (PurE)-related protein